jgi:Leucine rich repeat N-terminal domain
MYGNELKGPIPDTLSRCTNLKRIGTIGISRLLRCCSSPVLVLTWIDPDTDLFSNKLTGTIPKAIAQVESLQILHLKMNQLTGTIPERYGGLPFLSWFDVSHNFLHGTIPATFGQSRSIKDFRLGGNMFYDPIPQALCTNSNINGGLTASFGCDGVICPLGTYSDSGHATHADGGCKKCPDGEGTLYLGSPNCRPFSPEDILSVLFDAMQGERWPDELRENWKNQHVDVCFWSGVICDTKGEIVSIGFPTAWDDWANEGLAAPVN